MAHFAASEGPYFTTDAEGLFELFLSGLPDDIRQVYTCHSCRHFFERFGGLVTIGPDGKQRPAVWPLSSVTVHAFADALQLVNLAIIRAKVTGVFLSPDSILGTPETGVWHHLYVRNPKPYRHALLTAGQAMAEKSEERGMLLRGLAEFRRDTVERAIPLLESDSLYRSEKVLGVAKWLLARHDERETTKHKAHRENLTWRAVATAPPGWCHVRSTMISTLLDDIQSGMEFGAISRRFAEKMHPLQYLRPQAPPSAGNIAQAEKAIEGLKAAGSLRRRYATMADIQTLWTPPAPVQGPPAGGVFGHLLPKQPAEVQSLEIPPVRITWEKFAATVLPTATKIEYRVPSLGPFVALITAADPASPPILQWDREDRRNPVSWYVYHNGSRAERWGLAQGSLVEVSAVALFPPQWGEAPPSAHHGTGAICILRGAKDSKNESNALFPEILRSEFHAVRATIEAHSNRTPLEIPDGDPVAGVDLRGWDQTFRVTTGRTVLSYLIDRWS
ncbi:MAG: hypothetical protein Q8P41_31710 [Pseudomonadota bacterium]|nr:hypothetical protein [Pseudomonadota bacterium]